jgi:DNA invertase Pin-like site-specific DNA recombinase
MNALKLSEVVAGKDQKIIAYYRVSTDRQGKSGLGLEGQQAAVEAFARQRGTQILASYTEVESGRRSDRAELARALAHARRSRATLVVAKLDRLARNVTFLSTLMDSTVEFLACDNPYANRLTIHILAAVAEDEARRISERTKAALAAYKARGGRLGAARPECRTLTAAARRRGTETGVAVRQEQAREAYQDILPLLEKLHREGHTLRAMAVRLDELGHTTRTGKRWNPVQVNRLLDMVMVSA